MEEEISENESAFVDIISIIFITYIYREYYVAKWIGIVCSVQRTFAIRTCHCPPKSLLVPSVSNASASRA